MVTISETTDAPETILTPYRMTVGDVFEGTISILGDRPNNETGDWIALDVTSPGRARAVLETEYRAFTELHLYDSSGNLLQEGPPSNHGAVSALSWDVTAGEVYFLAPTAARSWADYGEYTLFVTASILLADGGAYAIGNWVIGGNGDDEIYGSGASPSLFGAGGHDLISAGPHYGWMHGGAGNDTILGSQETTIDFAFSVRGQLLSDKLLGGDGDDLLLGLDGNDYFRGGQGADTIFGGDGEDMVDYSHAARPAYLFLQNNSANGAAALGDVLQQVEIIVGTTYGDRIAGDTGDNRLFAGNGNDILWGLGGADILHDGQGNDTLWGGAGNDRFIAYGGADLYHGGDGIDVVSFEADFIVGVSASLKDPGQNSGVATGDRYVSIENLNGSGGHDTLTGNDFANQLIGRVGNDLLSGEGGHDTLKGGFGSDTLNGGTGHDSLQGGSASDTFLFTSGDGADTISDFTSGTDLIQLQGIAAAAVSLTDTGPSVLLDYGSGTVEIFGASVTPENVDIDYI